MAEAWTGHSWDVPWPAAGLSLAPRDLRSGQGVNVARRGSPRVRFASLGFRTCVPDSSFSSGVAATRERPRRNTEHGPVTDAYVKEVISMLNEVLATEIACGGDPGFEPAIVARRWPASCETFVGENLAGMLREDPADSRIVIITCQGFFGWLGAADVTARRPIEGILAAGKDHAGDNPDLLGP